MLEVTYVTDSQIIIEGEIFFFTVIDFFLLVQQKNYSDNQKIIPATKHEWPDLLSRFRPKIRNSERRTFMQPVGSRSRVSPRTAPCAASVPAPASTSLLPTVTLTLKTVGSFTSTGGQARSALLGIANVVLFHRCRSNHGKHGQAKYRRSNRMEVLHI